MQYPVIVLLTAEVERAMAPVLQNDGCEVRVVPKIANPHVNHPSFQKRLLYVFTKLNLFNMLDFDRIVYLDADTLVTANIDELFGCGDLCAVPRDQFFNAGVLVLTPRKDIYEDLYAKRAVLTSYNGGEQGFLNNYFNRFASSPAWPLAPGESAGDIDCRGRYAHGRGWQCRKLSATYNGDIGFYYLRNRVWWIDAASSAPTDRSPEPKVIHFTLGPFKPWLWWTYPIFELNWRWHAFYSSLAQPGTGILASGFVVNAVSLIVPWAFLLAVANMARFFVRRHMHCAPRLAHIGVALAKFVPGVHSACFLLLPMLALWALLAASALLSLLVLSHGITSERHTVRPPRRATEVRAGAATKPPCGRHRSTRPC